MSIRLIWADEWTTVDYTDEIKKQTGIDITAASEKDIMKKLEELHVKYEGINRERPYGYSLEILPKKHRRSPHFLSIIRFLSHLLPSRSMKARKKGKVVQMFQPILAGSEVGRGYSELNDPIDQAARFDAQQKLVDAGG